jgi:hypothetical protein
MEAVMGRHGALLVGCNKGVTPRKLAGFTMSEAGSD